MPKEVLTKIYKFIFFGVFVIFAYIYSLIIFSWDIGAGIHGLDVCIPVNNNWVRFEKPQICVIDVHDAKSIDDLVSKLKTKKRVFIDFSTGSVLEKKLRECGVDTLGEMGNRLIKGKLNLSEEKKNIFNLFRSYSGEFGGRVIPINIGALEMDPKPVKIISDYGILMNPPMTLDGRKFISASSALANKTKDIPSWIIEFRIAKAAFNTQILNWNDPDIINYPYAVVGYLNDTVNGEKYGIGDYHKDPFSKTYINGSVLMAASANALMQNLWTPCVSSSFLICVIMIFLMIGGLSSGEVNRIHWNVVLGVFVLVGIGLIMTARWLVNHPDWKLMLFANIMFLRLVPTYLPNIPKWVVVNLVIGIILSYLGIIYPILRIVGFLGGIFLLGKIMIYYQERFSIVSSKLQQTRGELTSDTSNLL